MSAVNSFCFDDIFHNILSTNMLKSANEIDEQSLEHTVQLYNKIIDKYKLQKEASSVSMDLETDKPAQLPPTDEEGEEGLDA